MLASATPSPPGTNASAPASVPSENTPVLVASETSRPSPRTQTYAARHSQNHDAAASPDIPASSGVVSSSRPASRAAEIGASRAGQGTRNATTTSAAPTSPAAATPRPADDP